MNDGNKELLPYDVNGFVASWVGIGALAALLFMTAAIVVATAMRTWMRFSRARRSIGLVEPGHLAAVVGVVELAPSDPDPSPPVVAEVRQRRVGTGKSFGQRVVWWSGRMTSIRSRPFVLRLRTGEAISVEPEGRVLLVDDLDDVDLVSREERVRRASLDPGEEVQLFGMVDSRPAPGPGYREAATGVVVRAPPSAPLLVSSQDHLPRAIRAARERAVLALLPVFVALGFLVWPIGGDFITLTARGEAVTVPVLRFEVERYRRKGRSYANAFVVARHPSGEELRARIDDEDFAMLASDGSSGADSSQPRRPIQVAFVVDRRRPAALHQLGRRPYVATMDLLLGGLATGLALTAVRALRQRGRPWYEGGEIREAQAIA